MSSENSDRTILIAGGGIGGLTASIALQSIGYRTQVFEMQPTFTALGVSVMICPNGVRALRSQGQGLAEELKRLGFPVANGQALSILDVDGNFLYDRGFNDDILEKHGEPCVVIRRRVLHDLLVSRQREGSLHAGKKLVDVHDDGEKVTAVFEDGSEAVGDALIGADGLNSATREALFHDGPPRYAGFGNFRGLASGIEFPKGWEGGLAVESGRSHVMVAPLGDGDVYVTSSFPVPQGTWPYDPFEAQAKVLELIEGWYFVEDIVRQLDPETMVAREIRDRLPAIDSWSVGRVTLLGDAAHAMTNFWGQGANTALEDAVIIARVLDGADDLEAAFKVYEGARLKRTRLLQESSARIAGTPDEDHEAFTDWAYGYDPATAPLEPTEADFAGVA